MEPHELRIRMYNVGFGDCFLLTFRYARDVEKHVLIDFGSMARPQRRATTMKEVADDIKNVTNGRLDAVVATHRHDDHISGFATNDKGSGPGNTIAKIASKALIVQPWTEDPKLGTKAKAPSKGGKGGGKSLTQLHVRSLDDMQTVARAIRDFSVDMKNKDMDAEVAEERAPVSFRVLESDEEPPEPGPAAKKGKPKAVSSQSIRGLLQFLGETNLKNLSAVRNLNSMSKRHEYLSYGMQSNLGGKVLPGVKVHVLGPPTVEQHEAMLKERQKDASEFWHLQAAAAGVTASSGARKLFPKAPSVGSADLPESVRWFVRKVRSIQARELLEIVRIVDKALNNTSVILLFEIGDKLLLFSGDAQIENWDYVLNHASDRAKKLTLLTAVDLYKVGHHGSLNATPKSLWKQFANKGKLISMLSTRPGKHGSKRADTEVPRDTLVAALRKGELLSTDELRGPAAETLCVEVFVKFGAQE